MDEEKLNTNSPEPPKEEVEETTEIPNEEKPTEEIPVSDNTVEDSDPEKTEEPESTDSESISDAESEPTPEAESESEPKLESEDNPEPKPEEEPEVEKEPENPDLVAQAEAETPAETVPAFGNAEPINEKKSKKPLVFAMLAIFILALGGVGVWYFLLRDKSEQPAQISTSKQETPAPELTTNALALRGNQLSDFDLAFLRLENRQDNVIYSPLSIKYALAMLQDGAAGNSKTQIDALIGDYKPKAYINSENLSLANAMFVKNSFKDLVLDSYIQNLNSKYNASVVYDAFTDATAINNWTKNKTLDIIPAILDDDTVSHLDFVLVNALAIDMNWVNQLQCGPGAHEKLPCKSYNAKFAHEKYRDYISQVWDVNNFPTYTFNNHENTFSAQIGASINRYDIVKELGEDKIRETVEEAYQEHLQENIANGLDVSEMPATADKYYREVNGDTYDGLNQYIKDLATNYGKSIDSTDFYWNDTANEKIFAKDLQEYDGTTLQYVGIMPKSGTLSDYIKNLTAEKATNLISNLKDISAENFKDGVITKIKANIPLFKFSYDMVGLKSDLIQLGITDIFEESSADLSNMLSVKGEYIEAVAHKADIDFSNDGIKAGAATAVGGSGAAHSWDYEFDAPVEEIDLTFDQPFLFVIRDKNSGEVWFTGTVYEANIKTE